MEDFNNNVVEEVVEPQIDNTEIQEMDTTPAVEETQETSVTEEIAEPQVEKPVQTPEQNALFAKIRREAEAKAEAKARDAVIAEMGMEWNGTPITSYQQYQQALREKQLQEEAQSQGVDPQFYVDFKNMQDELNSYRRNSTISQQDAELANDPVKGELYNNWKSDVKDLANQFNVDLKTAFSVVLEQRLGEVLQMNSKKIQQDTITKINNNQKSTPGSLGAASEQPNLNAWDMNDVDFEQMMQKAMRGELRRY